MKQNVGIIIGDISKSAGTERAVTNLSNLLVEHGNYNVYCISVQTTVNAKCYYDLDPRVTLIHLNITPKNILNRIIEYVRFVLKTNRIIKLYKLDFLLGTTHAYNILMYFMKNKTIKIACEHMNYAACPGFSAFARKMLYPKLNAVVLLTNADSKNYSFINENKKFVIPNSLSFKVGEPAKLDNKRIICVGRLTKQKGFDLLIEAVSRIKNELCGWKIDIFGSGEDKENLLKIIQQNDLSKIIQINEPTHQIKEELLNSSFYVMSSRWEGLPMILLEAKACGLPIISFDCPEGPADVVKNNIDGFLIENGNTEELGEYILKLCNDKVLRKNMGENAFINAKEFSSEKVFVKWEKMIERVSKICNKI